jgi:hypothetical protein
VSYHFGVTRERLAPEEVQRREMIAKRHQVAWNYVGPGGIPGSETTGWFAIEPGYGSPFDARIEQQVMADVKQLGRGRP